MAQPLDESQVKRAVRSLLKYVRAKKAARSKTALFEDDGDMISLILSLTKVPENPRNKPIYVPLPHSLHDDAAEICLFVKEDDAKRVKAKLDAEPVPGLKRVIGLNKLRKNYATFKARRELLQSFELFLSDDRIVPMLPKAIGKKFFTAKKQPAPIKVTGKKNLKQQVERARNATFLYLGWGACSAVRVALTSMDEEAVVENILAAMRTIAEKVPRKMKGIQGVHIKTHDSIALPVYNALCLDEDEAETEPKTKPSLGLPSKKNKRKVASKPDGSKALKKRRKVSA
jgi:ribosomal protein L1